MSHSNIDRDQDIWKNKKVNLELLEMRRKNEFSQLEIDERVYCVLKLSAHLKEISKDCPVLVD